MNSCIYILSLSNKTFLLQYLIYQLLSNLQCDSIISFLYFCYEAVASIFHSIFALELPHYEKIIILNK